MVTVVVLTVVVGTSESESELDRIRGIEGARVNVFPLGLEDIFVEIFGRDSRGELTGNDEMRDEGQAEQLEGKVQKTWGDAKEEAKDNL